MIFFFSFFYLHLIYELECKSKIAFNSTSRKQTISIKETTVVTHQNAIGRISSTKQDTRNNYIERRLDNNKDEHINSLKKS